MAFSPGTAHSPEIQSYRTWWGAASPILNDTPVVYTTYNNRTRIETAALWIENHGLSVSGDDQYVLNNSDGRLPNLTWYNLNLAPVFVGHICERTKTDDATGYDVGVIGYACNIRCPLQIPARQVFCFDRSPLYLSSSLMDIFSSCFHRVSFYI